jgi:hypothetical protein
MAIEHYDEQGQGRVTHAEPEHDEQSQLRDEILQALKGYAVRHNVAFDGTRTEMRDGKLVVTVPKYIEQEHRENMEQLAYARGVAENVDVQFIYEQSAG